MSCFPLPHHHSPVRLQRGLHPRPHQPIHPHARCPIPVAKRPPTNPLQQPHRLLRHPRRSHRMRYCWQTHIKREEDDDHTGNLYLLLRDWYVSLSEYLGVSGVTGDLGTSLWVELCGSSKVLGGVCTTAFNISPATQLRGNDQYRIRVL